MKKKLFLALTVTVFCLATTRLMAISYLVGAAGQALILGLSSDTKPSSQDGLTFLEEDTGKIFRRVSSTWVQSNSVSPSSFTYTFNADQAKLPGTNPPSISNSTNSVVSSLLYPQAQISTATWSTTLANYVGGNLNVEIIWTSTGTSGNVSWNGQLYCMANNSTTVVDTPAFGVYVSSVAATKSTAGAPTLTRLSNLTKTNCAQGSMIVLSIFRGTASDTMGGNAALRKVRLYE